MYMDVDMTKLKKLLKCLTLLGGLYYLVVVVIGVASHPEAADIAVVLGNEVLAGGEPSERLAARVDCALALYRSQKVKRIMVSGGTGANGFDEASVMAARLVKSGVPASDIIIDSAGINTMATAVNTAAMMQKENLSGAVIVTQYFHIPRTMLAFRMAGVSHFSADYPAYAEWRDIPSTLREMVAIPVYAITKRNY